MTAAVRYTRDESIGELVLDRPDNRNSMTPELLSAFADASAEARGDSELRALIIRGEGSCFSAGADFKSTLQVGDGLPSDRSFAMYEPFLSLLDIEVPVIAALNGHAVGGGFGLACVCDIRVANAESKYGANFAALGLHSGMAISYLLPRIVGVSKAAELLFTGRLLRGHEAVEIGLVSAALPANEVLGHARAMATQIAHNAPLAVRSMKRALYANMDWNPRHAARTEAALQAESLQTADAKEGMRALLEKRTPEFHGR